MSYQNLEKTNTGGRSKRKRIKFIQSFKEESTHKCMYKWTNLVLGEVWKVKRIHVRVKRGTRFSLLISCLADRKL